VIANHLAREEAWHQQSNGVYFYDGGYIDDGDFVLLHEMPNADYARGGVFFVGASELRAAIMPWELPAPERALIRNYALGDLRHQEVKHYLRLLVEEHGILESGAENVTIVLGLNYLMTRPMGDYVPALFARHHAYSYDWQDGIHRVPQSPAERWLRTERDAANRFLRNAIAPRSRVRPWPATLEWKIDHINAVMGEDWRANLEAQVRELGVSIDYLQARGVRVVALLPPSGSWQDGLPYETAYRQAVLPVLAARGVRVEDYGDYLADDEFGDDVHARFTGQQRLHEAYRELALRELAAMGIPLTPP
jgi:hypothetical protein